MMKGKTEHFTRWLGFSRSNVMKTLTACVAEFSPSWIRQVVFWWRKSQLSGWRKSFVTWRFAGGKAPLHEPRVGEPDSAMIMCFEP